MGTRALRFRKIMTLSVGLVVIYGQLTLDPTLLEKPQVVHMRRIEKEFDE